MAREPVPEAPEPEPDPVLQRVEGEVLGPVTRDIVEHMSAVVAEGGERRQADVFAKVGGSTTVNHGFLFCFDSDHVDLGEHQELAESLRFFRSGRALRGSPFGRESESAGVGWTTVYLELGRPPYYLREALQIHARYALLLVAGNDVNGHDEAGYGTRLLAMVRHLLDAQVIPVLGGPIPRRDEAANVWVVRHDEMTRAVAAAMRLPFIDYRLALRDLPDYGLGGDGLHPDVFAQGAPRGCVLTAEGLQHGNNMRNLQTLRMLDRLHRALDLGEEPDEGPPSPRGSGTAEDPYRVARVPFAARGSGPAVYRLVLTEPMRLRAAASRMGEAPVTVAFDDGRAGHAATAELSAGTHTLRVEGDPGAEHVLALFEDPPEVTEPRRRLR